MLDDRKGVGRENESKRDEQNVRRRSTSARAVRSSRLSVLRSLGATCSSAVACTSSLGDVDSTMTLPVSSLPLTTLAGAMLSLLPPISLVSLPLYAVVHSSISFSRFCYLFFFYFTAHACLPLSLSLYSLHTALARHRLLDSVSCISLFFSAAEHAPPRSLPFSHYTTLVLAITTTCTTLSRYLFSAYSLR